MITIKYFASLRETMGKAEQQIDAANTTTVGDAWQRANPDTAMPANLLMAVNQVYANAATAVKAGDEIAFFPPVTGG